MAIFNNKAFAPVEEELNDDYIAELYPNIMPTLESGYEIAAEGYQDMHKLIAGMYISDVLIESAVREGSEAEPLIEGAVKDFVDKAKAKFKEIRDKIVAWFKKIIENLKIRFTSTSKFVSQYKTKIVEKAGAAKGYEVTKHNFDTNVKPVISEAMVTIVEFAKADAAKTSNKVDENFVSRMVKKVDSKSTTIAEMKAAVQKKLVGEESKGGVSTSDVNKMIKYCEGMSARLAEMEDLKNANVRQINNIIKDLDGSGKDVDVIHAKVKNYNAAVSAIQQLNVIAVSVVNQINREYVAIMRGLLLYKPAKESYTPDEDLMDENKSSIFESAMNMI